VAVGLAGVLVALAATLWSWDARPYPAWIWLPTQFGGVSFVVTGVILWRYRPSNPSGRLMVLVGITWYIGDLQTSARPAVFAVGFCLYYTSTAALAHLVLALPTGRLADRWQRWLVGALYLLGPLIQTLRYLDEYPQQPWPWDGSGGRYSVWADVGSVLNIAATTMTLTLVARRWWTAGRLAQREYNLVWATAVALGLLSTAQSLAFLARSLVQPYLLLAFSLGLILMPAGIAVGLLRVRMATLTQENANLHATARAQLAAVRASRARIIVAADTERRRIQRDLHDGVQHKLLAISMLVERARDNLSEPHPVPTGNAGERLLARASVELGEAIRELRELTEGIYPPALSEQGLAAALDGLAERAPLPVIVDVPDRRWSAEVEQTAYFVVTEALANVYKHSGASCAWVRGLCGNDRLIIEVVDNGSGGADPRRGTGLRGLADRVAAQGGILRVDSPTGGGTPPPGGTGRGSTVVAELPCG
jgi:signal transduction histidine kinase